MKRFWDKVDVRGPDECWPWRGADNDGYGAFSVGQRMLGAHRVAFALANGMAPEALSSDVHVMHSCDNRPCCNARHLSAGTNLLNIADKIAKGRDRYLLGEAHPNRKLVAAQVYRIRYLAACGVSHSKIAETMGTHKSNVSLIVTRKAWAHLPARTRRHL